MVAPIPNTAMSVTDVTVIPTPALLRAEPILSGTLFFLFLSSLLLPPPLLASS